MTRYIFYIMLFIATYLEGTLTTVPLVLAIAIPYAVSTREESIFFAVFLSGIFLDLLSGQTIGYSSFYLLCSIFALLLYQRKYEIASYPFIALSTAVLSVLYLLIFVHTHIFLQTFTSVVIAGGWFMLLVLTQSRLRVSRHSQ